MSSTERLISHGGQKNSTYPDSGTDRHQNVKDWSSGNTRPLKKIASKSVHKWLRCTTKCQFTSYLLMVKIPENDPSGSTKETGSPPNLIHCFVSNASPLHKISSKSVRKFWRYFVHKKWLHTHTLYQTQLHYQPRLPETRLIMTKQQYRKIYEKDTTLC